MPTGEIHKIAIAVGGGPAPGINSVISAATIEARNRGIDVIGIREGFKSLVAQRKDAVVPLHIADVSRIHGDGGSILGTSREHPTRDPACMRAVLDFLQELQVDALLTIGGDGTAYTAARLAQADSRLRVIHVPKTIDNDLPLPLGVDSFGYQTARHEGVAEVRSLMEDARTTGRWYFVVAMGRNAGHLALGIGNAAGATLTVIGEEFAAGEVDPGTIADILEGAIIRRLAQGRRDGVAVLAEGLAEMLSEHSLQHRKDLERDEFGNVRFAEIDLGGLLKKEVQSRLQARGIDLTIVDKNIGYELRCRDPIPFDIEYSRVLGFGAISLLGKGVDAAMVTVQEGRIEPMPFDQMSSTNGKRTRVRLVDIHTEAYLVARKYMIRLRPQDLTDPDEAAALAEAGHTTMERLKQIATLSSL